MLTNTFTQKRCFRRSMMRQKSSDYVKTPTSSLLYDFKTFIDIEEASKRMSCHINGCSCLTATNPDQQQKQQTEHRPDTIAASMYTSCACPAHCKLTCLLTNNHLK
eukprot:scaffold148804_cov38-Prasinocladus_malaysianus.AAC.2